MSNRIEGNFIAYGIAMLKGKAAGVFSAHFYLGTVDSPPAFFRRRAV